MYIYIIYIYLFIYNMSSIKCVADLKTETYDQIFFSIIPKIMTACCVGMGILRCQTFPRR